MEKESEQKSNSNNSNTLNNMANTTFSDQIPAAYGGGFFDIPQGCIDMLAFQDYGGTSIFDLLQQTTVEDDQQNHLLPHVSAVTAGTAETVNTPTQNSSSVSCSSNEAAVNGDQENKRSRSAQEDDNDYDDDDDLELHHDDVDDDDEKSTSKKQ